jgi:2,3-bisphosphoglycerate-dependent phosphoglycerate mutase
MYKQFALKVYFSIFFSSAFFSCKEDKPAGQASNLPVNTPKTEQTKAPTGPVASDAFETAVGYENGKFKTASGKEVAVPMFGDAKAITFYIVRHAEKIQDGSDNPDLTLAGQQRASRLGLVLKGARVDYIATTNLKRSLETGKLLYQHLGSPPFQTFPPEMMQSWLDAVHEAGGGRGYVHVGHTNTIPELLKKLNVTEPVAIDDNDYANLLVVAIKGGKAEMVRLRYD